MGSAAGLPALDAGHAAAQVLVERLLTVLHEGIGTCPHVPVGALEFTWWPGATARSCLTCAQTRLRFAVFDIEEGEAVLCDGCGTVNLAHKPGKAYLLPVGPVLIVALLCASCGTCRVSREYDLDAAGSQITAMIGGRS
jgi:hypothetical protein